MARPPEDPDLVEVAVRLVRVEGMTLRDAARECGVSHVSVARWVKAAQARSPSERPPSATAPAAPTSAPAAGDLASTVATMVAMQQEMLAESRTLRGTPGARREATSMAKGAVELAPVIARLQEQLNDKPDGIMFSRAEIDAARAKMRERVSALCSRPQLCEECGRKLSIQWAGVREPD